MSLDKRHIDEMYKLSLVESAIDFTYSAIESKVDVVYSNLSIVDSVQNSKLDDIAEMVSALSAIDISEIESRVTNIQDDTEHLPSWVTGVKDDISDVESKVEHVKSDVEAAKSEIRHTKSDVEIVKSRVINIQDDTEHLPSWITGIKDDVSDVESKIDGPVSSHLVNIHNDTLLLPAVDSRVTHIKSDVEMIKGAVVNLDTDVSEVESKLDGWVYSNIVNIHGDTLLIPDVQSDVHAAGSRIVHVKSDVEVLLGRGLLILAHVSEVESKIDGWVYSNLVNVKDDTEHLPSWITGLKDDVATGAFPAGASAVLSEVLSHVENIHLDTQGLPSWVTGTKDDVDVVRSYAVDIQSHVHAIYPDAHNTWSIVTDEQSHVHTINSRVAHTKTDVETLLGYVTQSVASSYALRVVDSNIDALFDLQRAGGTLKLTAAEQNVYVNETPAGNYILDMAKIDLTNMTISAATTKDSVIIANYARIKSGGSYRLEYSELRVSTQAYPLVKWPRDAGSWHPQPNRYGQKVTVKQTGNAIAASFITVDYEYFTYS